MTEAEATYVAIDDARRPIPIRPDAPSSARLERSGSCPTVPAGQKTDNCPGTPFEAFSFIPRRRADASCSIGREGSDVQVILSAVASPSGWRANGLGPTTCKA